MVTKTAFRLKMTSGAREGQGTPQIPFLQLASAKQYSNTSLCVMCRHASRSAVLVLVISEWMDLSDTLARSLTAEMRAEACLGLWAPWVLGVMIQAHVLCVHRRWRNGNATKDSTTVPRFSHVLYCEHVCHTINFSRSCLRFSKVNDALEFRIFCAVFP